MESSHSRDRNTLLKNIQNIIQENFPQISMHGGSAEIINLNPADGIVEIKLTGKCSNCNISPMTMELLRERLPNLVPEIQEVRVGTNNEQWEPSSDLQSSENKQKPF